jgi:hypothetical protein
MPRGKGSIAGAWGDWNSVSGCKRQVGVLSSMCGDRTSDTLVQEREKSNSRDLTAIHLAMSLHIVLRDGK